MCYIEFSRPAVHDLAHRKAKKIPGTGPDRAVAAEDPAPVFTATGLTRSIWAPQE